MCRLFGLRANRSVDVKFSLVSGMTPFRAFGDKHRSGWGVGCYNGGSPVVDKEPLPADESDAMALAAIGVDSEIVVAHVRYATCGALTRENCHPFSYKNWLFAHNGGVDRESLVEKLDDAHRAALQGETDSEVFFHWILLNIEREGGVHAGLSASLSAVRDYSGLNFLLSDGKSLYAYRDASKWPKHYSLYFLVREPLDHELERFASTDVGALLHSKALRGEKANLICSEPLTAEDWRPIEMGHLLTVTDSLASTMVKVR